MKSSSSPRQAFTLVEIVVVVAIIGLLAALLFPVFGRARQNGYQTRCASNLKQIAIAVRQYREDEGRFPVTLESLLPSGSVIVVASGGTNPLANERGNEPPNNASQSGDPPTTNGFTPDENPMTRTVTIDGKGYLTPRDVVICPSDTQKTNGFTPSYGVQNKSVWNYFGYDKLGYEIRVEPPAAMRLYPDRPFDATTNPVKYSLANRFAPISTIVTHCIHHRVSTSKLDGPYQLDGSDKSKELGASDLILRLDGSAGLRDVSQFVGPQDKPEDNKWQIQNF